MSWDATLTDDRGHTEGEWNYTHNTNGMVNRARAARMGLDGTQMVDTWWRVLDGASGPEGARLLDAIIRAMEADPDLYVPMNPSNGWGDYHSLLEVLRSMRDAVPEWPTVWAVHG